MLRDMSNGSIRTSLLGITSELPIYIAPAAMAKLGHPLGEVNLTKAAGHYGIVQSVSCLVRFWSPDASVMVVGLCECELQPRGDLRGYEGVSGPFLSGLSSPSHARALS